MSGGVAGKSWEKEGDASSPSGGGCATLSDRAGDGVGRDRVPWWASTAADGSDSPLVIVKYL